MHFSTRAILRTCSRSRRVEHVFTIAALIMLRMCSFSNEFHHAFLPVVPTECHRRSGWELCIKNSCFQKANPRCICGVTSSDIRILHATHATHAMRSHNISGLPLPPVYIICTRLGGSIVLICVPVQRFYGGNSVSTSTEEGDRSRSVDLCIQILDAYVYMGQPIHSESSTEHTSKPFEAVSDQGAP